MMRKFLDALYALGDSWNNHLFPELLYYETAKDRAELWRTCYWRFFRRVRWKLVLALLFVSTALHVGFRLAAGQLRPWVGGAISDSSLNLLVSGIGGGFFGLFLLWIIQKVMRIELRKELNVRGFHVCMSCGYDLRGQETPRCPECGAARMADQTPGGP